MEASQTAIASIWTAYEKMQYNLACVIVGLQKEADEAKTLRADLTNALAELKRVTAERDSAKLLLKFTGQSLEETDGNNGTIPQPIQ